MTYNVEQNHKEQLKQIFNDSSFDFTPFFARGFRCVKTIDEGSILFVGINPSFKDSDTSSESFYDVLGEGAIGQIPYFNQTYKLKKRVKDISIAHLDLLFHRETSQNATKQLTESAKGIEFLRKQLQISKSILESCKPTMIVVCNSLARHFMGFDKEDGKEKDGWMGYKFKLKEDWGTHEIINCDSLTGIPVFLSSMLSETRALDKGSFERLQWHIEFVNNKLRSP